MNEQAHSRLMRAWAAFFAAANITHATGLEPFPFDDGSEYHADFSLPDLDIFCIVRPNLPKADCRDGGIWIPEPVTEEGLDLMRFVAACQRLTRRTVHPEYDTPTHHPRLYMLCGFPGQPVLQVYKGRWKLSAGSVALYWNQTGMWPMQVWTDKNGSIELWNYYRQPHGDDGLAFRVPLWPTSEMMAMYIGDGRDFASPRLTYAYQAANPANSN